MERLILDTSVVVAAERGAIGLRDLIDDSDDVAVAALTIAELEVGVILASTRRRAARRRFVDAVSGSVRVIDYDRTVARAHAQLLADVREVGRPRPAHDLIIAATAAASGRTLVTSDRNAFTDLTGVDLRPV